MSTNDLFSTDCQEILRELRDKASRHGDESVLTQVKGELERLHERLDTSYWAYLFAREIASAEVSKRIRNSVNVRKTNIVQSIRKGLSSSGELDFEDLEAKFNEANASIESLNHEIMEAVLS